MKSLEIRCDEPGCIKLVSVVDTQMVILKMSHEDGLKLAKGITDVIVQHNERIAKMKKPGKEDLN